MIITSDVLKDGVQLLALVGLIHCSVKVITSRDESIIIRPKRGEEEASLSSSSPSSSSSKQKNNTNKRREGKRAFPQIPVFPNSHPIFGHLLSENTTTYVDQLDTQKPHKLREHSYRGMSSIWYLNHPILLLFDPNAALAMLQSCSYREMTYVVKKHVTAQIGPKSILLLNGKEWKLNRNAIHKSMTKTCLKDYQTPMVQCSLTMCKSLKTKIANNDNNNNKICEKIQSLMKMVTMDVFFLVAIGMELKSCETLQTSIIAHYFQLNAEDLIRRVAVYPLRPWNIFYSLPSIENIKLYFRKLYLRKVIGGCIQERRIQRENERKAASNTPNSSSSSSSSSSSLNKKRNDLLANYFDAQEKSDNKELMKMSNDEFMHVVATLLVAGFETTSTSLTYALYLVSTRPDIEKYLLEEIHSVIGKNISSSSDAEEIDFDVEKLVLCKAVVNEALRLYPIAYTSARSIAKDDMIEINGVEIKGPALVRIPIWAMQRDEKNFPRPLEFLPERWVRLDYDDSDNSNTTANTTATSKQHVWVERSMNDPSEEEKKWAIKYDIPPANRDAFLAFSAGARSCAGKKFAYQEAMIILAFLIRDLKFEAKDGYVCVPKRKGLTQAPDDGLPMYISQR